MPHTAVLPIELYPPLDIKITIINFNYKPGEKFEFSFLIHEIIILLIKLYLHSLLLNKYPLIIYLY
jgi:hypothetical protein